MPASFPGAKAKKALFVAFLYKKLIEDLEVVVKNHLSVEREHCGSGVYAVVIKRHGVVLGILYFKGGLEDIFFQDHFHPDVEEEELPLFEEGTIKIRFFLETAVG